MGQKVYSQNGVLLGVPVGGSTQNLKAGDGITIDDNYISVDAHTSGNIEGNGTTDNPITLKDSITLGTVIADTVTGVKGNFGDVLIGRSDKVSVFIQKVKDLEAAQHEYIGGDHITVTDYVINLDNDVALKSDLPDLTPYALKTSLQDYIKSDALNNYYTKNETYNKNEIIEMLDAREYVGSEHIDITDGVISVKDLANTTVTSNNQTVTVIPTINEDGSTNYDLSVVGGQGGDTNIVGKWPVWSVDNGDGNWLVGADMTEWIKGKDVDEKLAAYQLIMTAGSDNVHIENNKISVDDTIYTGTAPIIVTDKVISFDDSAYATKQALATEVTNRTNADDTLQDEIDDLQDQIDNLPGALTPGDHIDITNGVISVTGIKDHEYTGDEYIIVDNTNDKITLLPKWVDWSTYWSEQLAIKGRATSLEGRMTAVENGKADIGLLNNYYTKSETLNVTEINNLVASKQDKLTAGDHISIVGNTISATGFDSLATKSELTTETNARIAGDNALAEEIAEKQDPISAGDHIRIDDGVTINAVGLATSEELTAEKNARTSADTTLQNNINGKQDKLTAGDGIKIENNVISVDSGSDDIYDLVAGTGIVITKDDDEEEVVIATTGLASANDLTQEVIARTNSYSYLEGQLATKQDSLTAGTNITITDNVISTNCATQAQLTYGLASKQDKLTAGTGITISENNVISSSGAPTIFFTWDFISDLLSAKSSVSRTNKYPDTVMKFGDKYNNGFILPAHAKVQITVSAEGGAISGNAEKTSIIIQNYQGNYASKQIAFHMNLDTSKLTSYTYGDVWWEVPSIPKDGTYIANCETTTFYFEVGDNPVNSNELFIFSQSGILYDYTESAAQVSFRNSRLSLNGMYWV